ncbi:tyrosine-type recombinase/integrase [Limosilactobacillus fermentum]|nr:tyrosine-type recombinase/integrase [Limosilactobacillus fermentum]
MRTTISITKRGSRYQARVNWYDNQDKRHQKSAGYFDRRKDAVATAERVRDELQEQLNPDLTEITLADYYQRWYQLYKEQGITKITQNRYKVIGNVLTKYFNKKKLKDVRKSDYQAFINWYGADHARDSVNKLNGAVKKMVSFALDDEIIRKDFTSNIQVIANKDRERKVEYLNQKETAVLMDAVKADLDPDHPVKYMILTALLTGIRKSEIQALTWNDLDFLHSTININKSWDEIEKAFKATKTLSSRRVIPVNRELLKMGQVQNVGVN